MGSIVGAGLISHVPPLVMPEAIRRELNNGEDTTLYQGLHDLGAERLRPLGADTVVVVDTHWFTTVEHIVTSHDRRFGLFTSEELPRGMCQMSYDMPGDRELAEAWSGQAAGRDDTWITAIDDLHLPVHYPTINLLPFLQGDEAWVSASICQTAEPDDFLLFGELLAQAVADLDRRVVVLASGGLSHRFWPLRQFRDHEGADPALHLRTPEARAADERVIDCLVKGDHAGVLDYLPEFSTHAPEGFFGHYLTMVGALGGTACTAPGEQFGRYEAVAGTGQVHLWFSP
ncbi:catechol 1,2-dioxygenase [Candidatus Poriferisocius sp.]|uniref:DODA-type extradiol aromatic ring-opening family dioxygenase n=1 Tax=Candidatus Poriferisocius sp. TaxID=3101276 RepID=UPI003B027E4C